MTTFFTADLHLSHARINELSGRPFSNLRAMNAALVKGWNSRVTDEDTVWVLGDVCMGPIQESLDLIPLLAGRKILMPGNHDRCWDGHPLRNRSRDWDARYLDAGFAEIVQGPFLLRIPGFPVLLSHFPYSGDSHDLDRYTAHRPADDGGWLLHGHVHEKWRQRGRMINVGVDAWQGKPVSEDTVVGLMAAGARDLDPRPWA